MYNWKLFTLQLLSRHLIQRYLSLSSICKFNDISLFEYVKLKMFSISHTFRAWNKHCYQCLKWQNKQLFCLLDDRNYWWFEKILIKKENKNEKHKLESTCSYCSRSISSYFDDCAYLLPADSLSIFGIFQLLQYLSLWFSLIWLGQNYVLNRLFSLFLQEDFLLLFENVIHMIHSFCKGQLWYMRQFLLNQILLFWSVDIQI